MFISYYNFGALDLSVVFTNGAKISSKSWTGYLSAVEEVRRLHKTFGVENAILTDHNTGEVVAEIWPDGD